MIALRFAVNSKTNVILAGDPKQLGPIIHSTVAARLGLGLSLLERLMALDIYKDPSRSGVTYVISFHCCSRGKIATESNRRSGQ